MSRVLWRTDAPHLPRHAVVVDPLPASAELDDGPGDAAASKVKHNKKPQVSGSTWGFGGAASGFEPRLTHNEGLQDHDEE
jgi:hypothetical protein